MSELDDNRIDREYEEAVFAAIINRVVRMDNGGRENNETDGRRIIGKINEQSNGGDKDDEEDENAGNRMFIEWKKESAEGMPPGRAMDQRCLKTIRGYFAKKRAKRLVKSSMKYVVGAAAMVALFCLCVGVIFPDFLEATKPVVRESILDFMAQRTANNIEYTYLYYEGTENQLLSVETGWLPENLEVLSCHEYDNSIQISLGETENGVKEESLRIDVYGDDMTSVSYTEYEEVTVQGNIALLNEKEYTDQAGDASNSIHLEWYDPDSEFMISILADNMEREDVLHLAEELTFQWEQGEWTVKNTTGFGSMDGD
ncbi:MAG: hypothetical protein LUE29_09415 [Lachnospiraceae bacterium]|nr:hypothetical protein [Lachnospiraceae bacterium]